MDIIVSLPAADAIWDELNPQPQPSVLMAEYDDSTPKQAYLYTADDITAWPVSAYIVGAWDRATGLQIGQTYDTDGTTVIGTPTNPVTSDYTQFVRPLGNDQGRATGPLDSMRWQGMPEEKFLADANRYPASESPFQLKIERVLHPGGEPEYPVAGWGWTVTMISEDSLRDITARGIGIYSDPECTAFLYTTGAFILETGEYKTHCPPGQVQPTDAQVNFALLLGSLQEGWFNLPEGGGESDALFWAKNQPTGEWATATAYNIGDVVTYSGSTYECIQAHTSQPAWTPPAVPALWSLV